ncbi:DUF3149 domain-containing protein [Ideonella livida]|uniref:DUF3149 domain-containing protein n=1 Tax=Ideonella livida TaxID=2707176 RepID=A0A7C9TJS7_9BURK|nr:DUF3149 domain-containing protein [Ideonella livida]NDY92319.1 DUF3149 domain-containing protein [Ideonella livida]
MHALRDFLTTDYGLLSLAVIVVTLGMGVFYTRYFIQHIRQDEAAERARLAAAGLKK